MKIHNIKLGDMWDGCVLVSMNGEILDANSVDGCDYRILRELEKYNSSIGDKEFATNNIWYDSKVCTDSAHRKCFSAAQYQHPKKFGKDHNFYTDKENFVKYSYDFYKDVISPSYIMKNLGIKNIDNEFIYGELDALKKFKNKDIMIVAAGPTAKEVDWKNIDYDYLWTCNKFYKFDEIKDEKVDLVSLAPDVSLRNNVELFKRFDETDIVATFGLDWGQYPKKHLYKFAEKYPEQIYFCFPRYGSAMGTGVRMMCYAAFLGAKNIYTVGIDGIKGKEVSHIFEPNKEIPNWYKMYGYDFQRRQMVVFWEYFLSLQQKYGFGYFNLGEDSENNVLSNVSKQITPLTDDIRNKIKL